MDVTTSAQSGGPTPATLATVIADPLSDFSVDTSVASILRIVSGSSAGPTDTRAIGLFTGGNVASGTSLQDPVNPAAVFSGGIGAAEGICLSTGLLDDNDPTAPNSVPSALDVGVQGPNNGFPIDTPANQGETSRELANTQLNDDVWALVHSSLTAGSGDPAALAFAVELDQPGLLRIDFAFGSDEYPDWIDEEFNDTFVIIIEGASTPLNGENIATLVRNGIEEPFTLVALSNCPDIFRENRMSPASLSGSGSPHNIPGAPYYDHEFAGFSKVLTRETSTALAPGRYTIKIVIQDVADRKVDSALFIPEGSLKLFSLAHGDYNGDGCVDGADFDVWLANYGKYPATFYDGDGDGDGAVTNADYAVWYNNLGNGGNVDSPGDFNRDGCVDEDDFDIWLANFGMGECATRFEGDATGDGAVDTNDFTIWNDNEGNCGNCGESSSISGNELRELMPADPDTDGDGNLSEAEFDALQAIAESAKPEPFVPSTEEPTPADE